MMCPLVECYWHCSREYDRAEEEGTPPPHPPPPPSIRKEESEREESVPVIEILRSQKFLIDWKLKFLAQNFFFFFLFGHRIKPSLLLQSDPSN